MTFYEFFQNKVKDKRILILGLGKEGLSSLKLLLKTGGYSLLGIADEKEPELDSLCRNLETQGVPKERLAEFRALTRTHFKETYQNFNNQYDLIFKSPGVVLNKDTDLHRVTGTMQVFTEFYREQIIGITGTKGKSTTASLLTHVLKENGISAVLAGNIGIPVFDILDDITSDTAIVLEMSCHQLEYMTVSPKTAILLNLHQEHLDHYGSYAAYCTAKYNIFKYMEKDSRFIGNTQLKTERLPEGIQIDWISYEDEEADSDIRVTEEGYRYRNEHFRFDGKLPLPGIHNLYNIAAIHPVVSGFRIPFAAFQKAIASFHPLPHRLEYIGCFKGIDFYDDSISTMGSSTISAIKAVRNTGSVLIGGMDRGIDYTNLTDFILEHPEYFYILMEATGKRIYSLLEKRKSLPQNILLTAHLEDAVQKAFEHTERGKACILSPAAASYGIFRNFEHRGEVFQELVQAYPSGHEKRIL